MATEIYLGYPSENIKKWIKVEAERKYQERLKEPLCFTAEEPNAILYFKKDVDYAEYDNQVVFSYDKQNWSNYEFGTEITLANVGDKVYFKAADDIENWTFYGYQFDISRGKIAASGNLNTLLKADGSVLNLTERDYCFRELFYECSSLTQAPELPATTLADDCYGNMFQDCTSLTQAPALPATTLANFCYSAMFDGCTSLSSAPALPATTLANFCYGCMFQDCTSLSSAPVLPATTLANGCYDSMFYNCTSLTQASFPNLEKETVAIEVVESQSAFFNAEFDIEATCKDGILIINSTAV